MVLSVPEAIIRVEALALRLILSFPVAWINPLCTTVRAHASTSVRFIYSIFLCSARRFCFIPFSFSIVEFYAAPGGFETYTLQEIYVFDVIMKLSLLVTDSL